MNLEQLIVMAPNDPPTEPNQCPRCQTFLPSAKSVRVPIPARRHSSACLVLAVPFSLPPFSLARVADLIPYNKVTLFGGWRVGLMIDKGRKEGTVKALGLMHLEFDTYCINLLRTVF